MYPIEVRHPRPGYRSVLKLARNLRVTRYTGTTGVSGLDGRSKKRRIWLWAVASGTGLCCGRVGRKPKDQALKLNL
eukprot:2997212-Rhodomonas_salina.1